MTINDEDDEFRNFEEYDDDFPADYEDGKAWAEIRLISPTGMDSTTTLPKLTLEQGRKLNILVMLLAAGEPVTLIAKGKEY